VRPVQAAGRPGSVGGGANGQGSLFSIINSRLSTRGRIEMDARTNSLVITDLPEYTAVIEEMINKLDRPEPLPATMGQMAWHHLVHGGWEDIARLYVFDTRALTNNLTLEVGYVGSTSKHMPVVLTPNTAAALIAPGLNVNPYRSFPDFGNSSYVQFSAAATYNSMQTTLRRRYAGGLTFLAAHTYSHSLDDAREPFPQTGEGGYRSYPILGRRIEYSNSPFDIRHRAARHAGPHRAHGLNEGHHEPSTP
jgi:hypothetical protein